MKDAVVVNTAYPCLKGLAAYPGPKALLSRGLDGLTLREQRVAVIGVDAHAVRLLPELARQARTLKLFMHTPHWVLPVASDGHVSHSASMGWGVVRRRLSEWRAKRHLHRQVREPWLRRQLLPQYLLGSDRGVSFSNSFYPALLQPHCELVTWPIDRLSEEGIRTCDGLIHEVDCVLVAE